MKFFNCIIVVIVSCCVVNCSNEKDAGARLEINDSTNIITASQLFDLFNEHNWQEYAALYSDSATFLDPSLGKNEIVQSREQTMKKYADLQKAIPDIKDSLVSVERAGENSIVIEFVSKWTLPDKSKLYLPICTILKFKDGKIISDHTYFDN